MRDFLFNKYTAFNYIRSQKIINEILTNYKELIDNKKYELLANKIINSYVSYNFPWKKILKNYNVLFHSKGVFNDEIIEAFSKSNNFNLYQYSRKLNRILAQYFFPEEITHFNFKQANLTNEIKNCFEFYDNIFRLIKLKKKLDIIYSGNFGLFDESQLALAAIKNNIKFVSFHKECIMSPGQQDIYYQISKIGRDKFNGNRILVYNDVTKKLLEKIGVCEPKNIQICPMVRLDKSYISRKNLIKKNRKFNRLTYFYIQPNNQLPSLYTDYFVINKKLFDDKPTTWTNINENTNKTIYEIAINNPKIEVVIKCKFQDFKNCEKKFSKFGKIPKNLKIIFGSSAISLISTSDLICAFNTTSILEAAVAGKTIISPYFDEALHPQFTDYLIDFGDLTIKAKSPSELKDLLNYYLKKPIFPTSEIPKSNLEVIDYWTSNTDGNASKKLRLKTIEIIKDK